MVGIVGNCVGLIGVIVGNLVGRNVGVLVGARDHLYELNSQLSLLLCRVGHSIPILESQYTLHCVQLLHVIVNVPQELLYPQST